MIKQIAVRANRAAAPLFFIVLFCLFGSKQIGDHDFWWHLRTGQYIAENVSLPESDPFASSGAADFHPDDRQKLVLRGYWLSQLIFDDSASIFIKEGELNKELIHTFSMPKYLVFNTAIANAERGMEMAPANPKFYISMAVALRGLGRDEEAKKYFEKAKSMLPAIR